MIVIDPPMFWPKFGRCAHLVSTLPGQAGAEELARFARDIGMKPTWLQKPGTAEEHYDLMRGRIKAAADAGARQVARREFVSIIRAKREGREHTLDGE